jgi:chromosomal replication initiation ATPase DnaA
MKIWQQLHHPVSRLHTFDNFYFNQEEIKELRNNVITTKNGIPTLLSAQSGNGVTHLLHALCNQSIVMGKKAIYINGQTFVFILKRLKGNQEKEEFLNHLLSFDMLALDNIQFLHKKSKLIIPFFNSLMTEANKLNKEVYLGCSNPIKDFTKVKKLNVTLNRVEIKSFSSLTIFNMLRNLCEFEKDIPESLLYTLSSYNGTMQQYINCLISIRFKSKASGIDLHSIQPENFESELNLYHYFPKQQFRKCFYQAQLSIWNNPYCVRKTKITKWTIEKTKEVQLPEHGQ